MPNFEQKKRDSEEAKTFQLGDDAWKLGKYDEARKNYQTAARLYHAKEDFEGMAIVELRRADLEISLENFKEADKSLVFAISFIENLDYAQSTYLEILIKLAKSKSMQANSIEAFKFLEKAKVVANNIGSYDLLGDAYDLEALINLQENKEKKALEAYKKAAEAHEKSGTTLKEAATLRAIARIEIKNKNYDYAHDVLEKCRDLYRENGDLLGEASALSAIGSLRYIIRDIENARKALQKSVYLYGKVSHHFAEAEALLYLARVEAFNRQEGDFGRAKAHYKRSIELFDFLDNQTMKDAVLEEYYNFLNRTNIGE
ncbi:MAG: tetratricopeptide repeat protein [Alphaproteobacteria bacterium]